MLNTSKVMRRRTRRDDGGERLGYARTLVQRVGQEPRRGGRQIGIER